MTGARILNIDGGIVGLCVLLFVLVACGRRIIAKIGQGRYQRMRFAILIVMIFYNLSESMYVRLSPIWFTTLMMLVEYPGLKSTVTKAAKTVRVRGGQILSPASGGALDSPVRVV